MPNLLGSSVTFEEVMQMAMGIGKFPTANRKQTEHILRVAFDGLRYQAGD